MHTANKNHTRSVTEVGCPACGCAHTYVKVARRPNRAMDPLEQWVQEQRNGEGVYLCACGHSFEALVEVTG